MTFGPQYIGTPIYYGAAHNDERMRKLKEDVVRVHTFRSLYYILAGGKDREGIQ